MRWRNPKQSTFENIFALVYWALIINVLLAVTCTPVLVPLLLVHDPLATWPTFVLLSVCCGPAVTAALWCFDVFQRTGDLAVWREFFRGYRRMFRRGLALWAVAAVVLAMVGADIVFLGQFSFAWLLVPLLAVLGLVVAAVAPTAFALAVLRQDAGVGAVAKGAFICSVRTWYLALLNAALGVLIVYAVALKPLIGLLLAPSVILFVIWVNAQYITRSVIGQRPGLKTGGILRRPTPQEPTECAAPVRVLRPTGPAASGT